MDISCLPRECSVHRHDVFARAEGFSDREIVPTDELRRLLADRRRRIRSRRLDLRVKERLHLSVEPHRTSQSVETATVSVEWKATRRQLATHIQAGRPISALPTSY